MWILYAFLSAIFAGITAILAKIGMKNVDSYLATALRTIIVGIFAWIMAFVVGSVNQIAYISGKNIFFLIISGLTTGGSWICYFKALQLTQVNKVVPIDKSSIVLTILLAVILLGEKLSGFQIAGMIILTIGTYMMIQKGEKKSTSHCKESKIWFLYALLSAIFASLTTILGKIGIQSIESNLGTAIRTMVVLILAWIIVFILRKQKGIKELDKKNWIFICLSGFSTGGSWLFYYRALQEGEASIVAPIDKLSIVITIIFARILLKEKISKRAFVGLIFIVVGTMGLLVK